MTKVSVRTRKPKPKPRLKAEVLVGELFGWPARYDSSEPGCYLTAYSVPTGCGLMAVTGVSALTPGNVTQFKRVLKNLRTRAGNVTMFATLGDHYPTAQKCIKKLGFVEVVKYINPGHGDGTKPYYQHLYILHRD